MTVEIQDSALKELKKLDKTIAKNILQQLCKLEEYPNISNIKKLKNHYPPMRYRIGDYRILFDIDENEVLIVIHIKHRKEAYGH